MIVVKATDRSISATPVYPITSGSVGLPVIWTFSEEWDGLSKIAVFRGSGTSIDVALLTDRCTVPAEVLEEFGDLLWIGVYGANASGQVVIPTIWCQAGLIREGVVLAGVDPAEPTPSWVAQVQAAAASALSKATAVEEAAEAGDFDGVSPTISVSDITGGHRVTITDAEGAHTVDVMDGAKGDPGESPVVAVSTITGGHRVTIADVTGTHSFNVMDGAEGDPGDPGYSPTVSVTDITGGHRVTITDASGAHTFDVMDGEGGGANVLTVNVTVDGGFNFSADKTYAELTAALSGGAVLRAVLTDTSSSTDTITATSTFYTETDGSIWFRLNEQNSLVVDSSDEWDIWNYPLSYGDLNDKPQINGVTLTGNKTSSQLGLVASNQGTANAGKFMVVGSDGIVAPVTMQAWQGGSY